MKMNPVGWFEIYVSDMARARKFYEAVFKVKLERLNTPAEMWAFGMDMKRWGACGALTRMPGFRPRAGGTLVYFSCADCAVEAARVRRAGGKLERRKTSIGEYGYMALAYDTEGNMIGLHSIK